MPCPSQTSGFNVLNYVSMRPLNTVEDPHFVRIITEEEEEEEEEEEGNICGPLVFLKAHFSDLPKYTEYLESSSLQLKDAIDLLLQAQVSGPGDKNSIKHSTMRVLLFQIIAPGIPLPPQPILTRRRTWLDVVNYYAEHYGKIMEIIDALDSTDSSAVAAVKSLPSEQLLEDVLFIDSNFKIVSKSITLLESSELQLSEALNIMDTVSQTVIQNNNSLISEKVKCKLRNIIAKYSAYSQLRIINGVLSDHDKTSEVGALKSSDFPFFKYVRITSCDVQRTFSRNNYLSDHRYPLHVPFSYNLYRVRSKPCDSRGNSTKSTHNNTGEKSGLSTTDAIKFSDTSKNSSDSGSDLTRLVERKVSAERRSETVSESARAEMVRSEEKKIKDEFIIEKGEVDVSDPETAKDIDNRDDLELNGLHQLLVYADGVTILGENPQTIRENMGILLAGSKEIGFKENSEKTKYMIMSRDQNIVRNGNIEVRNLSFEEVENFKYLGATVT
ncbi:hypothetical protein ANN_03376 [Periplaneta americana]|uniref:Uncharacterized protein n=1 Tax=Periplaneta americana TaxID=6978 RepID=A0ABQ8U017_PERAM|nr:hypothetical protein ANN_03376 [Periplaneta americana]